MEIGKLYTKTNVYGENKEKRTIDVMCIICMYV